MAKRVRGSGTTSAYRPGQAPAKASLPSTSSAPRPGTQPPAAIPGAAPRPSESESMLVIEGLPEETHTAVGTPVAPTAAQTTQTSLPVRSHQRGHVKVKPTSALAARAAQEYVYVGEDLRHIAKVGITMLVLMVVLWLVIVAANVFHIY
ncbi:MAG: hypothetical protein U0667_11640 [Chloroflexota bacterium]